MYYTFTYVHSTEGVLIERLYTGLPYIYPTLSYSTMYIYTPIRYAFVGYKTVTKWKLRLDEDTLDL